MRIGDTVRRDSRPATKTVHALLRHFERMGFAGAPRPLGFDQQGREILSFIPGDVAVWKRPSPLPNYVRSEDTLVGLAQLIRQFHDCGSGFSRPADAMWSLQEGASTDGEVICHNDLGPWNTVFVDARPVAFIDWDGAAPGPREWDLAYALYRFVPFQPDEICALIGWIAPPDRLHRTRVFCDAYGLADRRGILDVVVARIESMVETGRAARRSGDPQYGESWMDVMQHRLIRDMRFVQKINSSWI